MTMYPSRSTDFPSYPAPPNVPPRTLGHPTDRGLSPWFHASAVNSVILRRLFPGEQSRSTPSSPEENAEVVRARSDSVEGSNLSSTGIGVIQDKDRDKDRDREEGLWLQVGRLPAHLRLTVPRPRVVRSCDVPSTVGFMAEEGESTGAATQMEVVT